MIHIVAIAVRKHKLPVVVRSQGA